jgi:arylsulfatase
MQFVRLAAVAALWPLVAGIATADGPKTAPRPNIVIIMSDDMGFSDIGCYGGEIETPTLNRLADGGLRFTQFYNTARCCPTRASLLSGLYPHQAGVGHMMEDRGYDGYRGDLNRNCVTIAEALRPAGYATYGVGKWHVAKATAPEGPKDNWPLQRGFDRFYGTITGAGSFYDPSTLVRDNTMISPFADPEYKPETYYYTYAISDNAVKFIAEHHRRQPEKPFFMYVAFTAAHWPMHALEKDVAKYKGKYDAGYGAMRQARFERAKQLGLIRPDWELSPQAGDWDAVENREWEIRSMEVYAAMIDSMDQGIGRIVAELETGGLLENTLVFFLQDNGGCAEGLGRTQRGQYTTRPDQPPFAPMAADEIQRDMIPKQTRDGYPFVMGPGVMPGPDGTYIAYGQGWANVSNTPFREYKHWVHEGGISTPLVAHWPAGIQRRGELENQPGHLIDLMATCVDVSGATYPQEFNGNAIKPMEGRSLVPAFEGRTIQREALYWEHEGNRAVRVGKWKLAAKGENGPWELYDMEADRTEMHDLAAAEPDRVAELAAVWQAYAERANVLPLNPRPEKAAQETFSKKKRFTLKQGDDLRQERAPYVVGRSLAISATIDPKKPDGVIVAQGGSADGYSLYLEDGKLTFAIRRHGELQVVAADQPLPPGPVKVAAQFGRDGRIALACEGQMLADETTEGLLTRMPLDGLQVGSDDTGAVGPYESPNAFAGSITDVTIVLAD